MKRSTPKSRRTAKPSGRKKRKPPRLVLDTNVLISALLWTGPSHQLLEAVEAGRAVLIASPSLIDELREVIVRPKFAARLAQLATTADELVESLLAVVEMIEEPDVEAVIAADPDDDRVLACARAGNARYIVSGDRHLLGLKRYRRISILTPAAALTKLSQQRSPA